MKFCSHCGKEIMDEAVICPHCGCSVSNGNQPFGANPTQTQAPVYDAPSTGFWILGFFIPLVGLILYLVNKDRKPLKARSAGMGALIGFIVNIVLSVILSVL